MKGKLNFKQPKYIFPLVILLPILFLAWTVASFFDDESIPEEVDGLNMTIPDANTDEILTKYDAMSRRFAKDDDAYTALGDIGKDDTSKEDIEDTYTEEEKAQIDAENELRRQQEEVLRSMQESFAQSRDRINRRTAAAPAEENNDDGDDFTAQYQQMQELAAARQKMMMDIMTKDNDDTPAAAPVQQAKPEPPSLVVKAKNDNADKFTTISDAEDACDQSLIKAMIDKTTKASEGTRLRFKLLDDVTIDDVTIKKGTYLYGIVVGFGQQRVMAEITSIMVGNRFLKVSLAVFDNDGMEGFYVPESSFRDFMKDAGSAAVRNNINFTSSSYGSDISGESLALQALQNIYNAGTNALSSNIKKNKAKIKYNTIVYLINSKDAQ